jgi:hypothetical protein
MHDIDENWMAYVDREVRDACDEKRWACQVRRKWSVREKPVAESSLEDYEWKLIPDLLPRPEWELIPGLPPRPAFEFEEGVYYVLRFDRRSLTFILQHDTTHGCDFGPHMDLSTSTEIHLEGLYAMKLRHDQGLGYKRPLDEPGPDGWLTKHLVHLTTRFQPNRFSIS